MIGVKIQNQIWEKALLDLLGKKAEKYRENCTYAVLLTDTTQACSSFVLGQDITLPFHFDVLNNKLSQAQEPHFENNDFKWLSTSRQLIRKKDKTTIQLTEKESEIIGFLANCPHQQASREEILQAVWHYQNDIHTHTLESHIYSLRQKLTPNEDQFIVSQNGIYTLIS